MYVKVFLWIELKLPSEYIYAYRVEVKISGKEKFALKYCQLLLLNQECHYKLLLYGPWDQQGAISSNAIIKKHTCVFKSTNTIYFYKDECRKY